MRPWLPFVPVILLSVALAACSGPATGRPEPAASLTSAPVPESATGEPTEPTEPRNGAPAVDTPLDLSHFLRSPCDALTSAQITDYFGAGTSAKPDLDTPVGPECSWSSDDLHRGSVAVVFPHLNQSLPVLYGKRSTFAYFEELPPADGYPAVATSSLDLRPEGRCSVVVGVGGEATVDLTLKLSKPRVGKLDPCEAGHEAASAVIGNIKERN
ncbi:DUF3558 domain-containing protein [Amycolatopsis cihanbeyliensis]|uniref:Uncharacterized protein DUF3558 n=1 Tax=Amycolatopsis cihanbeyliensis TaxID=1128664 RepID=A0A542DPN6_AMYCI|nr:DUF3558 domain-containing protein [Amycolatopsis cihanbeyliensis]TQJ04925.1 uncharacterized protein DUF3558 [Amycolatopsis cihanbeyliensis]